MVRRFDPAGRPISVGTLDNFIPSSVALFVALTYQPFVF